MSNEENYLTPGERELETALRRLTPSLPSFTLQQAYARSLVAAERRRTRVWQGVAALLAIAAGAAMWSRPSPRMVEVQKIVFRDSPAPANIYTAGIRTSDVEPPPSLQPLLLANGDFAYLRLRDKVLLRGIDSLRVSRELPASSPSPRISVDPRSVRGGEIQTPWYVDYLFSGGRS